MNAYTNWQIDGEEYYERNGRISGKKNREQLSEDLIAIVIKKNSPAMRNNFKTCLAICLSIVVLFYVTLQQ